jgi:hypothetical protein
VGKKSMPCSVKEDVTNRVIHEERSIFLEVTVSVIVRKKSSYDHVSNSERLPR